jgi:hypothetical protein
MISWYARSRRAHPRHISSCVAIQAISESASAGERPGPERRSATTTGSLAVCSPSLSSARSDERGKLQPFRAASGATPRQRRSFPALASGSWPWSVQSTNLVRTGQGRGPCSSTVMARLFGPRRRQLERLCQPACPFRQRRLFGRATALRRQPARELAATAHHRLAQRQGAISVRSHRAPIRGILPRAGRRALLC